MHSSLLDKQWRHTDSNQRIYIHVPFDRAVVTSSVISEQAAMCIYSLVSDFCFRHFSVKQLKFEIYIILCRYSYHCFIKGSKNKNKLVKLTFRTAIPFHQDMGISLKKVWVM